MALDDPLHKHVGPIAFKPGGESLRGWPGDVPKARLPLPNNSVDEPCDRFWLRACPLLRCHFGDCLLTCSSIRYVLECPCGEAPVVREPGPVISGLYQHHADTEGLQFHPQALSQSFQRKFRRAVHALVWYGDQAGDRPDIHNAARFLLSHFRQNRATNSEYSEHIHFKLRSEEHT